MEDVLVKTYDFTFMIEFVILDMKEDAKITIILGIPLLLTFRENID